MLPTVTWSIIRRLPLAGMAAATLLLAGPAHGQGISPTGQELFVLNLAGTPVGEIPIGIKQLSGLLEVVLKDGVPMLKASATSEFLITLPQVLPADFTIEVELVPKACCNPEDLALEGTPAINQGPGSARLQWDSDGSLVVVGGGPMYQAPMPEELGATLPGVLTRVVVTLEGGTVKLYTNGRRMYTLTDRRFARGRVLRVFLGGQDDNLHAVYLARLRIASGTGELGIIAAEAGLPTRGQTPPAGAAAAAAGAAPPPPPTETSGTATQSQASKGGKVPSSVANVTVTQGAAGPVVDWLPVAGPATYAVRRWRVDDPGCCNAASGSLSAPPWQDASLQTAGTYRYEVTATMPGGTATGEAQFVQFATRGRIATVAPSDSGAAGTILTSRSPGATASPTTGENPKGAAAAARFAPPAPRTIALSAISATGLPRASAPAARTITLSGITATGGQGSGASPPPRTIGLGELIATGPMIVVKAPTRAIAGLPGTSTGSAAPAPRTIPLAGITGSGGGGMARVPVPRSIALGGFSAAGNGARTINIPPRTITLPAITASGSEKTP